MAGSEHVLYLGSFSKSLYPGLRLGFMVADQTVVTPDGRRSRLADEMSKVKSLLTVNSSPLTQAIAAGVLIRHGCSLREFVRPRLNALRANRDALLQALEMSFPRDEPWCRGVHWNRPEGGFFLTLTVPFSVDDQDVIHSAAEYKVTWTPMSYFYVHEIRRPEIRLAFSYVTVDQIHTGVPRLAAMIKARSMLQSGL
jgi:(S)-3,5-dihydroxyphenylglycine transaminase